MKRLVALVLAVCMFFVGSVNVLAEASYITQNSRNSWEYDDGEVATPVEEWEPEECTHEFSGRTCKKCGYKKPLAEGSGKAEGEIPPPKTSWEYDDDGEIPNPVEEPAPTENYPTPEWEYVTETPWNTETEAPQCQHDAWYQETGDWEWEAEGTENICMIGTRESVRTCSDCWRILETSYKQEIDTEHDYEGDVCKKCGYTKPHEHTERQKVKYQYEEVDNETHVYREITKTYCKECLLVFEKREREYNEEHNFDKNNQCRDCGYINEEPYTCDHQEKERYIESQAYYQNNEYHEITDIFEKYCQICGEELGTETKTEEAPHMIIDGKCVVCNATIYELPDQEPNEPEEPKHAYNVIVLHIDDATGYCDGNRISWQVPRRCRKTKQWSP